ncbi:MAG: hypothetical protein AB1508_18940 [Pseudomonadota bacterium]
MQTADLIQLLLAILSGATQNQQAAEGRATNTAIAQGASADTAAMFKGLLSNLGEFGKTIENYLGRNYGTYLSGMGQLWDRGSSNLANVIQTLASGKEYFFPTTPSISALPWEQMATNVEPGTVAGGTAPGAATAASEGKYDPKGRYPRSYLSPEERAYIEQEKKPDIFGRPGRFMGLSEAEIDQWLWKNRGDRIPASQRTDYVPKSAAAAKAKKAPGEGVQPEWTTEQKGQWIWQQLGKDWKLDKSGKPPALTGEDLGKLSANAQAAAGEVLKKYGLEVPEPTGAKLELPSDDWLSGYAGRFKAGMAEIDKLGKQVAEDINTQWGRFGAAQSADIRARGMAGTSAMPVAAASTEQRRIADQRRLQENLAQTRLNWGEQLSGDFLNNLGANLMGFQNYDTSMGLNALNEYRKMWPEAVTTGLTLTDAYNALATSGQGMQNQLALAQLVDSPAPVNWGDIFSGVFQDAMSRAQARAAQSAQQSSFFGRNASALGSLSAMGGDLALGALGIPTPLGLSPLDSMLLSGMIGGQIGGLFQTR